MNTKSTAKVVFMKTFFISILVIIGYFYVQSNDYNDELISFKQYCLDINSGFYPDYKQIKHECSKLKN